MRASWGRDFEIYALHNVLATQRLLEAVADRGVRRFVYASSSSVYGDTTDLPMREQSLPRPISPYGVTKLAAEHLCWLYWRNYGLPTVSLRYFTVYGPRQRPDMAFHRFLKGALRGEEITLYDDGEQTRDFTYVSDVVAANVAAAERGEGGEVFNIGGGSQVSINQVLDTIEAALRPHSPHAARRRDKRATFGTRPPTAARRASGAGLPARRRARGRTPPRVGMDPGGV